MAFAVDAARAQAINIALKEWRQGDLAGIQSVSWIGSPTDPLTEASAAAGADTRDSTAMIHVEVDAVVVTTQTCDIVRDCVARPLVTASPLVMLDEQSAAEARRGMRPRFAYVPGLGELAFADLDRAVTVEKSVLVASQRTPGTRSDTEIRRIGLQIGRKHSRFAFPDDLGVSLKGLVQRVRDKHDRKSPEGRALSVLEEIRVSGTPSWSANQIDVFLTFAPPTRAEAEEVMDEPRWDELIEEWLSRAEPFGVVASVDGAMIPFDELTAREYIDSDPLDLDHLST